MSQMKKKTKEAKKNTTQQNAIYIIYIGKEKISQLIQLEVLPIIRHGHLYSILVPQIEGIGTEYLADFKGTLEK